MNFIKTSLTALMLTAPLPALAATTVYETTGDVVIDTFFGTGDYIGTNGDLNITVTGSLFGGVLDAFIEVGEGASTLLTSSSAIDFDIDTSADFASITFDNLSGAATALFGSTATVEFSFDFDTFDTDSIPGFGFLSNVTAQVVSDVAPVPLPASLPLLGAALAGAAMLRRKQRRS